MPTGKVAQNETVESLRMITRLVNSHDPPFKVEYVFDCCWKDLESEGCRKFMHYAGRPKEMDGVTEEKYKSSKDRSKKVEQARKNFIKLL